jgi:uncharacterized protein YdhG (YjbR/CyaY superfamily)
MKKAANIDEYISGFPGDVQEKLNTIRQIIKEEAPGARESISYGMPAFKLNGNVIYFAGFKSHIGLYPAPSAVVSFRKELAPYQTSTGTIKFPLDKLIPYELIKKIVKFRMSETFDKSRGSEPGRSTGELFLGF